MAHDERVGLWEDVQQGYHLLTGDVPKSLTLEHRWYLVGGTADPGRRGKTGASPAIITITALQQIHPWSLGPLDVADPRDDGAFAGRLEPQHEIRSYLVMDQAIVNQLQRSVKTPGHRQRYPLSPKTWARRTTARFFGITPTYLRDLLKIKKTQTRPRHRPPRPRRTY